MMFLVRELLSGVMARLDRAIQTSFEESFAAQTRGGWMAASSAALTQT
jgi:hypothetical protein